MRTSVCLAGGFILVLLFPSFAADIAGSKTPYDFLRFKDSEIVGYAERSFDDYTVALGPGTPGGGFTKMETAEGQVTRVLYRVPAGHTALEVFRNYEAMLKSQGFAVSFTLDPCESLSWARYFNDKFYLQTGFTGDNPFDSAGPASCYLTAKGAKNGKQVTVALLVAEVLQDFAFNLPAGKGRVAMKAGQILAEFDVVTGEAVADQMVVVKAQDMANQLAATGKVDIYGILFDVDKTDIKPESKPTLDQVALLLKNDPKLNLEISGHTDNTGTADHNMKLSQGRANAVVQALVKSYGIAAGRLHARGYGATKPVATNDTDDGRAKNRRVELTKL
ncbi:MAG TPA: OmpA family protein [Rhizomicrobium sp.]|nr:OmpA family protein [Rhizomicrobium sp.]